MFDVRIVILQMFIDLCRFIYVQVYKIYQYRYISTYRCFNLSACISIYWNRNLSKYRSIGILTCIEVLIFFIDIKSICRQALMHRYIVKYRRITISIWINASIYIDILCSQIYSDYRQVSIICMYRYIEYRYDRYYLYTDYQYILSSVDKYRYTNYRKLSIDRLPIAIAYRLLMYIDKRNWSLYRHMPTINSFIFRYVSVVDTAICIDNLYVGRHR